MDPHDEQHWDAAQEGAELLGEGSVEAAIVELSRLVIEDPKNPYGFHFLGAAYFEQREYERALKAYLTALELTPTYVGSMIGAGHALRMMGRLDQAIRMGRQALARRKDDPDALYLLGVCHFVRGDEAAAIKLLDAFLATRPELEVALEVEGMLQTLRGEVVPHPEGGD